MTQHLFMKRGSNFTISDPASLDIHNALPVGTYVVECDPKLGFYVRLVDDMTLPPKIYGNTVKMAERIYSTFESREASTGALLDGDKGSGKSLLTKQISKLGREKGAITLLVNLPFVGDEFAAFLQGITQPTIVLIDEFEKVYDGEKQQGLLTILDGVFTSKKLFLLTCNDSYRVNQYMKNRPGRLFYALNYKGLDIDFIREYCADNLNDKSKLAGILNVFSTFASFTFDMLKALVEEMNRYNESATDAMKVLNIRSTYEDRGREREFQVDVLINGQPIVCESKDESLTLPPLQLQDGWTVFCYARSADDDEVLSPPYAPNEIRENLSVKLDKSKLKAMNAEKGEFLFDTDIPGAMLQFKRIERKPDFFNYDRL